MFTGIGSIGGLVGGAFFATHHKYGAWGIIGSVIVGSIAGSIAGYVIDSTTGI
jgi:uncharacterized membrane protein YeaQ/YmgE (transglycosylase-associated protein family)